MKEDAMEPDYEKFEELMTFLKSMPHDMHVSWHEALEAASALPEGKRSQSELRRLIAKARNVEDFDFCYLEGKLGPGDPGLYSAIEKSDVEQNLPLTFGRMLGMKVPDDSAEPDNSTEPDDGFCLLPGSYFNNVWEKHFLPLAKSRQNGLICTLVSEILLLVHYSWREKPASESVRIEFDMFRAYLKEKHRPWHQKWTTQFPELLESYPTEEMRAELDQEFCDWIEKQDSWLRSEEV